MTANISINDSGDVTVSGELNMQTVPVAAFELRKKLSELLPQTATSKGESRQKLVIDFSQITRSDSAGVALLVDILQQNQSGSVEISFSNIPQQMRDIAKISGLLEILPVS